MPIELPSGSIPDATWDRIQQAVLARGDVEEALSQYRLLSELQPDNPMPLLLRGLPI